MPHKRGSNFLTGGTALALLILAHVYFLDWFFCGGPLVKAATGG